jgi:hypothetical protein
VVTLLKAGRQISRRFTMRLMENNAITLVDKTVSRRKTLLKSFKLDFTSIAWMSSLSWYLEFYMISFGRIELTFVAFYPDVDNLDMDSWADGIIRNPFNNVNIIISTLIFGLGDDYSLFIMDGLLQEYKTGKKNLESYKSSILLSAITTLAGLRRVEFCETPCTPINRA